MGQQAVCLWHWRNVCARLHVWHGVCVIEWFPRKLQHADIVSQGASVQTLADKSKQEALKNDLMEALKRKQQS
ncbi:unnamed protein product [Oncorhynchus mykiss]|uniref:Uncharacterized protein n=1 Tax=Oncorhynchus mykiss TaxID=8022 RepID=A0A060WF42_ONCMY|nr:unnamed protein product [Oncorhynchus mykiss]